MEGQKDLFVKEASSKAKTVSKPIVSSKLAEVGLSSCDLQKQKQIQLDHQRPTIVTLGLPGATTTVPFGDRLPLNSSFMASFSTAGFFHILQP
ncbi:hypothetical protein OUZ56_013198 [Daphnia magna]|uniref:Uncharacterized protein n=1 Tax=Daphnia magna TaxID=35525 RepID=A0ABQ9Z578_9CRUS|nr:hypothetical protein OUZ56_013198 [Daphnia magna]